MPTKSPFESRPASPTRPPYITVASRHCPTPSGMSKPDRSVASPQPTPMTTIRTPRTSSSAPASTTQRRAPHASLPVLSIHDLERRYQNKSSASYDWNPREPSSNPPSDALTRLLHAVADLLGLYNPGYHSYRL
ncbi:hypothetical protein P152DRAFT_457523 [Eremomyces bilateralis CBS 781.70]|uniref:Uncharacterized protein n=1 Tax=Eremomyces bilateralis CBS 781.70 TaxID=1392243 RepID=A0A6G1G520_9PEZI|nr:uncharacterized protein P152DRAFT_457523 [Eremomyces bilateralis CBS 781.70]KAF1813163.1 hypothetical protein P152DRAFT_457523 [Eremomyces bilateralis CBS 781.70]